MKSISCSYCGAAPDDTRYPFCSSPLTSEHRWVREKEVIPVSALTPTQTSHLESLQVAFVRRVETKYRKGAAEHGGNLQDMPPLQLIDNAIDECIDQFTYLMTLREKFKL